MGKWEFFFLGKMGISKISYGAFIGRSSDWEWCKVKKNPSGFLPKTELDCERTK